MMSLATRMAAARLLAQDTTGLGGAVCVCVDCRNPREQGDRFVRVAALIGLRIARRAGLAVPTKPKQNGLLFGHRFDGPILRYAAVLARRR